MLCLITNIHSNVLDQSIGFLNKYNDLNIDGVVVVYVKDEDIFKLQSFTNFWNGHSFQRFPVSFLPLDNNTTELQYILDSSTSNMFMTMHNILTFASSRPHFVVDLQSWAFKNEEKCYTTFQFIFILSTQWKRACVLWEKNQITIIVYNNIASHNNTKQLVRMKYLLYYESNTTYIWINYRTWILLIFGKWMLLKTYCVCLNQK